jgi:hypothetical protein
MITDVPPLALLLKILSTGAWKARPTPPSHTVRATTSRLSADHFIAISLNGLG